MDFIIKLRKLSEESSKYSLDREGLLRKITEDPKFRKIFSIYIRKSQWEFQFFTFSMLSLSNLSFSRAGPENSRNCSKKILKNIDKIRYFSLFFNEI